MCRISGKSALKKIYIFREHQQGTAQIECEINSKKLQSNFKKCFQVFRCIISTVPYLFHHQRFTTFLSALGCELWALWPIILDIIEQLIPPSLPTGMSQLKL